MARKKKLDIFEDEELKDEAVEVIVEPVKQEIKPIVVGNYELPDNFSEIAIPPAPNKELYVLTKYSRLGRKEILHQGTKEDCIQTKITYEMAYPGEKCNLVIKRMVRIK
jgi:hypothetical protein